MIFGVNDNGPKYHGSEKKYVKMAVKKVILYNLLFQNEDLFDIFTFLYNIWSKCQGSKIPWIC